MKKILFTTLLSCLFVFSTVLAYGSPKPDIRINGSNFPNILTSGTIHIAISLDNDGQTSNADWWVVADTPDGIFFFTPNGWVTSQSPIYQGPLFRLSSTDLLTNHVAKGEFPRTTSKQKIAFNATPARYVRLVALSEIAREAWTSAAEIEVMEQIGGYVSKIPSYEMSLVRVDSEETHGEDGRGENAIDGDPSTIWHTEWYYEDPKHPHEIVIDLGHNRQVCGFGYLPRQDGCLNGGIAKYEFYVGTNNQSWSLPVKSLTKGTYTFYLAVDTKMDSSITSSSLYFDEARVIVK